MSFRKQIEEDLRFYQENYKYIPNIEKDEWAFNFWILDKLFYLDENIIEDHIIEYNDMGIDSYLFFEDTKDLYLIQNKYYSDNSSISTEYIRNDFLLRGITALENGTYGRCDELQTIFNRYKDEENFNVYLDIYVTNNNTKKEISEEIANFNIHHSNYIANIYYLEDIKKRYFNEIKENKISFETNIYTINKGTILNINNSDYKLKNIIDAKYVFTPISCIYNIYLEAEEKRYPLFEQNIREYLGQRGNVNKKIYETLIDKEDRKNFFYYNNGITLICDKINVLETKRIKSNMAACFTVLNPQIVNGAQTVNTIKEVLKNVNKSKIDEEFADVFVMLKILEIDKNNDKDKKLYQNIVTYNNSQNKIEEKTFIANEAHFQRIQEEFLSRGFLLLIKQSDKNQFKERYKFSELKKKNNMLLSLFGVENEMKKIEDLYIPLEKLLQVILSFIDSGYKGYIKKSVLLKKGSNEYNLVTDFIKNKAITMDILLNLYLLYRKAEITKKNFEDRFPVPLYLIDSFSKNECDNKVENILTNLNNKEKITKLISLYTLVSQNYYNNFEQEYNKMIKLPINFEVWNKSRKDSINSIKVMSHLNKDFS